MSEEINSR